MNVSLKSKHKIGIGSAIFSVAVYLSLAASVASYPGAVKGLSAWTNIIVFLIFASVFFFGLKKISSFSFNIFENITIKNIVFALGCSISVYAFNYSMNLLFFQRVFKSSYDSLLAGFQLMTSVPNLTYACLLGPMAEELLMRGYVLGGLRNRYGAVIALLASSLLFAVFHFSIVQGMNALVMGIIFGLLYLKTGSIFSCMLAHVLNNSIAMYIMIYGLPFSI